MFKVFFLFSFFFINIGNAYAQTSFSASKDEQEKALSKYINASAVCAKMTDIDALYERGMLLISDANDEAYIAAADCFTSASMKNHTPSQLELGKLYEFGKGVTQSNIFAYKWYQTAVLLGNQEAISFRNRLEARMSLEEISLANPMIKSTLDLIEAFNQRQQEELEALEKDIEKEYLKFGVNIAQYDIKDDDDSASYNNPLIDSLIREQKKKQGGSKNDQDKTENEDTNGRRPRRPNQND